MVRGGYGQITDALAAKLDVRLGCRVALIAAGEASVKVKTLSGTAQLLRHQTHQHQGKGSRQGCQSRWPLI